MEKKNFSGDKKREYRSIGPEIIKEIFKRDFYGDGKLSHNNMLKELELEQGQKTNMRNLRKKVVDFKNG
jgi:hypothetical protein